MRLLLALLPGVLALAAGCYGANTDSDEEGGNAGSSGAAGSSAGGQASGGSLGKGGSSAGSNAGGSSAGTEAGGSASAGTGTGGTSCGPDCNGIVCEGDNSTIATIDKSCQTAADCVQVAHMTDCCGSVMIMGINAGAEATFAAAEEQCTAGLPICDCAPRGTALEDGTWIALDDTNYAIACLEGQCQSVYGGLSFACGDILCTEQQYCTLITGGPAGSGTSASCSLQGDCKSCDCLPASVGCGCSQDESGYITVSCAAP